MSLFGGIEIPGHPDLENVAKLDRLPVPVLRRMVRIGMAVDPEYFHGLSSEFSHNAAELQKDIASFIPPDRLTEFGQRSAEIEEESGDAQFNAGSAEQIGKLLFEILGVGKDKPLKMTKAGDRLSTGKKQLELVRLEHPVVPLILRHRELTKLKSTYTDKLPKLARFHPRSVHGNTCPICELEHRSDSWRVHGELGTTRADTGRINHKNPNLGNIPTRTEDGQRVQAGFIAPEGYRLVAVDLSQIELRGLAHLANDQSMINVYLNNGDIHDNTGRKVFNLPDDVKPDKIKHRMASKRCNFSIQNGTSDKGLYMQLVMDYGANGTPVPDWLTEDWCKWFIEKWLEAYPEVQAYFDQQYYRARRYGLIWDTFGRVKLIPEMRSTHSWIKASGLRQAQNMPVTALAAGQFKIAMARADASLQLLYDNDVWCWPLVPVHDMMMAEVEEDYADEVLDAVVNDMNSCMVDQQTREHCFRVPISSDGDIMERWAK